MYDGIISIDLLLPICPSIFNTFHPLAGISSTRIDLVWTDNSADESGFKIERCRGKNCKNFVEIAQVNADVTSFSDTGANRNTAYRYRIRAFSPAGDSEYSNVISVKTPR